MKLKFFGRDIPPSCDYCEYSYFTKDTQLGCVKKKALPTARRCVRFIYAPQKRSPRKKLVLPKFTAEDFKL